MWELFEEKLTDKCTLRRFKDKDRTNKREFYEPVEVDCRIFHEWSIVKLNPREELYSKRTIYLREKVNEQDNIDGDDVLEIIELRSLFDDEIWGYRVKI